MSAHASSFSACGSLVAAAGVVVVVDAGVVDPAVVAGAAGEVVTTVVPGCVTVFTETLGGAAALPSPRKSAAARPPPIAARAARPATIQRSDGRRLARAAGRGRAGAVIAVAPAAASNDSRNAATSS